MRLSRILFIVIAGLLLAQPATAATSKPRPADPVRVVIPVLGVNAKIENQGTTAAGVMVPPKSALNVAWHLHSVRPGDIGNAVMYGHLNTRSSSTAVFSNLHRLRPGNTIRVTDAKKITRVFRVTKVARYKRDELPLREISGRAKTVRLNLYTCAGYWNRRLGDYSHRLVVFTELQSVTMAVAGN